MRVERCEFCQGKGVVKGIFHLMECAGCNGGGVLDGTTKVAIPYPELVAWLRDQLARARRIPVVGSEPGDDYVGMRNVRGTGGGNWTGD